MDHVGPVIKLIPAHPARIRLLVMGLHRARMHTSFRQAWSGFLAGRCGEGPNVTSAGRREPAA